MNCIYFCTATRGQLTQGNSRCRFPARMWVHACTWISTTECIPRTWLSSSILNSEVWSVEVVGVVLRRSNDRLSIRHEQPHKLASNRAGAAPAG